jgi:hypothetical protein
MPWVETESLFKSTLRAAIGVTSPQSGIPEALNVVDLGEAGRQEVWQSGSKCIQKTIAKHGGKRALFPAPRFCVSAIVPGLHSSHNNDWPSATLFGACNSICILFCEALHSHVSDVVAPARGARGT